MSGYPVRQRSARGLPKPITEISRTCAHCGACFIGLAAGKTGEAGLWTDQSRWYCSVECYPAGILPWVDELRTGIAP